MARYNQDMARWGLHHIHRSTSAAAELATAGFLGGVDADRLAWLDRLVEERRLSAGEVLVAAGEDARWVWVVVDGAVATGDGVVGRGGVLCEPDVLALGTVPATATALAPSRALGLPYRALTALIARERAFALRLARRLAGELTEVPR